MNTLAAKGYQVRHLRDATVVPCPCGASHRIFTRADTPVANLHVTEITDSRKHYHKRATANATTRRKGKTRTARRP